jgi:hypothetical protein
MSVGQDHNVEPSHPGSRQRHPQYGGIGSHVHQHCAAAVSHEDRVTLADVEHDRSWIAGG